MELNGKPTYWTHRAKRDLEKIFHFNKVLYGTEKAKEISYSIRERTLLLENPEYDFERIGSVDESFNHLKHTYRKLIEGYCKITYRIGKKRIYIVRVFDTRQHPSKNL
ncbi:MAG: type II toxin-antitoxin system RelE/ParE family toxin [Aequorivita sp.]|uniref:Plasmid stabilization protein n=1 Tax=Aequorivita vladivostokensis TaxID=171194 RepID=A0ABR5DLH8_9FLAO|nr:plasmid stabilization protein [Aequorivita vladivostokensis]MAB57464.1 type II toxin-antitoxin system RelE/ParE family toxin [Aequorivita sp.]MBF32038.1 type II toxin-antitoxin system RelE/ParE family toxin [Aequorivita sp.]HBL79834.1 type II toxin-antitoxin system RelE/ParE family toxin [Aequorivita sp.]